ncbi:RNA methyltransferase [Mycoplasmopsis cynos]|uniref:TrmH family RNA methyltransferase n=1 Tax=Mycoplasmopsis cynos TaxID=171284 RepID=UPI002AFE0572|nr:RNA methyltransferase [Mycoplasmopsis cynos]WQQ19446.1 RNA methyltransferase [Mycoplasmopsis cynos]
MILTSKQNIKIKELKKLHNKKFRKESNLFLISGYHLVNEALTKDIVVEILETEDSNFYQNSTKVSYDIISYLSQTTTPQKVIAVCNKRKLRKYPIKKVVALNNLQDPGNVGTIIRIAKAFNFDTVIIENLDVFNDKVIRASQGALFKLNIIETNDLESELIKLKNNSYTIYETLLNKNTQVLNSIKFVEDKMVIVFGNEANGIRPNIQKLSDLNIYIPIEFESLNVAISAGIVLDKVYNRSKDE